ncbi:hypothetical protein LCGC14_1498400 [marine sediment metagenome]|uniref:Uncharacterized protein n=1 Tax=marine sediment metagenome TaxID=412755 RepID=A0A0F9M682_9ZZZZ
MKIPEEIRKKLREPLPSEAVSPHPTKTYLSTIKAIYVTERINDVFGLGSWTLKSEMIERIEKFVVVKAVLEIPDYGFYGEAYGGNDNIDIGDAYKGATTDALTKIAGQQLEIGIDVFKGLSTGKKTNPKQQPKPAPKPVESPPQPSEGKSDITLKMLADKASEKGYDPTLAKAIVARLFHAGEAKDLNQEQRKELLEVFDKGEHKE